MAADSILPPSGPAYVAARQCLDIRINPGNQKPEQVNHAQEYTGPIQNEAQLRSLFEKVQQRSEKIDFCGRIVAGSRDFIEPNRIQNLSHALTQLIHSDYFKNLGNGTPPFFNELTNKQKEVLGNLVEKAGDLDIPDGMKTLILGLSLVVGAVVASKLKVANLLSRDICRMCTATTTSLVSDRIFTKGISYLWPNKYDLKEIYEKAVSKK